MNKEQSGYDPERHDGPRPDNTSVGRTNPDPAFPGLNKLVGLQLGNSPKPAHWRLYLTDTFDRYLEFRKSDTVDAARVSSGQIVVWLKPGAKAEEIATAGAPEEFLLGKLQRYLDRSSRAAGIRRILALEGGFCNGGKNGKPKETAAPQVTCGACQTSPGSPGCPSSITGC